MRQRVIVCPVIQNEGEFLLCKMASDRGVRCCPAILAIPESHLTKK